MALSVTEGLSKLFRKSPDLTTPFINRPELKPGGKGYLIIPIPYNPGLDGGTLASLPEHFTRQPLDINANNPNTMDYLIANPDIVNAQAEFLNIGHPNHRGYDKDARIHAEKEARRFRRPGHRAQALHYPDRSIVIKVRSATINGEPVVYTSQQALQR